MINTPHIEIRAEKVETPAPAGHTADGMEQSEFARLCGVTPRTVQNWDNGGFKKKGIVYNPKIYEHNRAAAVAFAVRYRTMRGESTQGIIHGYAQAEKEAARRYTEDLAADLRRKN